QAATPIRARLSAAARMAEPMHIERPSPKRRGSPMTLTQLIGNDLVYVGIAAAVLLAFAIVVSSTWIISENESGLVIKKYGPALAAGRLLALDGEAGYQARLLPPGWHFVPFRWQYRVVKVPTVVVPPGQIALVVAADGAPIP